MASAQRKKISRRVRFSYAASTVSMTLVLFLLGAIGFIMANIFSTTKRMRESVTMIVELKDNLSEAERDSVAVRLAESEMVASLKFVSKEEKIEDEEFRKMFATEIESILEENPLRNSLEVVISTNNKADTDRLVDKLSAIDGVVYVAYPASTIEQLHSTITKITIILAAFGGALLIISLILLNNTIRLAIFSRRYLINTLKLVGATKGYIMRPFLATAAKQGLWAGLVASLLFVGSLASLSGAMPEIIATAELIKIAIVVGTMILTGLVISLLFTTFAVGKFVNMKSNKIYLY